MKKNTRKKKPVYKIVKKTGDKIVVDVLVDKKNNFGQLFEFNLPKKQKSYKDEDKELELRISKHTELFGNIKVQIPALNVDVPIVDIEKQIKKRKSKVAPKDVAEITVRLALRHARVKDIAQRMITEESKVK